MSKYWLLAIASFGLVASGCSSRSSETPTAAAPSAPESASTPVARISNQSDSSTPRPWADTNQPEEVVAAFLDALRDGDDRVAEALLTSIAQRETREHELAVQPPGSPSARYEIGEVKQVQGGVHVYSRWSETDDSGEQADYEIVWVLRHESVGWRVAGMATKLNPAKPAIFLNFEDVPDLLAKWQQADQELAAAAEEAPELQAAQPSSTLQR